MPAPPAARHARAGKTVTTTPIVRPVAEAGTMPIVGLLGAML